MLNLRLYLESRWSQGDASIPQVSRLYLRVHYPAEAGLESKAIFLDKVSSLKDLELFYSRLSIRIINIQIGQFKACKNMVP